MLVRTRKGKPTHININCTDTYETANFEIGESRPGYGGADGRLCKAWIDIISGEKSAEELNITPLAGRMSVAVGYLAAESLRNGSKKIDIPPLP